MSNMLQYKAKIDQLKQENASMKSSYEVSESTVCSFGYERTICSFGRESTVCSVVDWPLDRTRLSLRA